MLVGLEFVKCWLYIVVSCKILIYILFVDVFFYRILYEYVVDYLFMVIKY